MIIGWCRQAEQRDILKGDLCFVQVIALNIAEMSYAYERYSDARLHNEYFDNMFDAWLMVEHHNIWESVQRDKSDRQTPDAYMDISEMKADDMRSLIEQLRRNSDVERGMSRH